MHGHPDQSILIGQTYSKGIWVNIPSTALDVDAKAAAAAVKKVTLSVKAAAANLEEAPKGALEAAAEAFANKASPCMDAKTWTANMKAAAEALGIALAAATADTELTGK